MESEPLMSKKTLVSIIIPCYNYAHFLEKSVGSVLNQTYSKWECLIIDDGSKDNTKAVASKLMEKDSRIKYFYQQNKGSSASRNLGFTLAQGEYIQFLDADDIIHPCKLQEQVDILDSDPSVGVSYTNYQTFQEDLSNLTGRYSHLILGGDPLEDFLFKWERGLSIPIHAALFRRSVFEKHEKPFEEILRAQEDWVMWVQLAADGVSFNFLDKDYCYYREHGFRKTTDYKSMYSSFMKAVFIILTIVPSSYHKKFVFSSLKHAEATYLDIILNLKAKATLFYDIGENFHSGHALTQSIIINQYFNFSLVFDLSQIDCINQLRFDPLEGHLIRAKLYKVNYQSKAGEIKELDLSTVTSNGYILNDGYTLFHTFDPIFFIPIAGKLKTVMISGEIYVLENREIENLLMEKEQVIKKLIQEKAQFIAGLEQALQDKGQQVAGLEQTLAEKEQQVAGLEQALAKKEQAVAEVEQVLAEKEQQFAGFEQALAKKEQAVAEVEQTLAEKEQQVAGLEQALAEKEQAVAEVEQALAEKEQQFAGLEQALAEKVQVITKLERNQEVKEQVIYRAAEKINRIEHELSVQSNEIEQRIQEIEAILNSKSWRITAPLRIIATWVKKLLITK